MQEKDKASIHLLPYHVDPLDYLAEYIIHRHAAAMPVLDNIHVLMPGVTSARHFRHCMLRAANRAGHPALLGLHTTSLATFIHERSPQHNAVIPAAERELRLVGALRDHPTLYGNSSPWLLAEDLLQLFDELALYQAPLPGSLEQFRQQLGEGYALAGTAPGQLAAQLDHEARLVYTLWQAWQQQLQAEQLDDPKQAYSRSLLDFQPGDGEFYYLVGYQQLLPAEQHWFERMHEQGRAMLVIQGRAGPDADSYHPDAAIARLLERNPFYEPDSSAPPAYSACLSDMFDDDAEPIRQRAGDFASRQPDSPLRERLAILSAADPERQALGIELQIRQWRHAGHGDIGIVTQDRRLSRRLRALLERVDIPLLDSGGWAMSTTRAAAVLERWLECLEQDFDHLPLLDLLKSPFVTAAVDNDAHLYTVYRFERDIVQHENIARGLYRYRRQLDYRAERLAQIWQQDTAKHIHALLDRLEAASKPLMPLVIAGRHTPAEFLDRLGESLALLGIDASLATDAAGQCLLDELASLRQALADTSFRMSWSEFHGWLGRNLERQTFRPATSSGHVRLVDPANSDLAKFDALIIAAADTEHLPGRAAPHAFFNDAVRHALGLPTRLEHATRQFHRFRCLLEGSQQVLLSYHVEENGNAVAASPWLEVIRHYHELAWHDDLEQRQLQEWLAAGYHGYSQPADVVPRVTRAFTRTPCQPDLLPGRVSASAYQQLVDCPYRFYMARCLNIKASDEIRETLEKADYGNRIHRCLEAFHADIEKLPGPFNKAVTAATRDEAINCLREISAAVFARDLEDNFQHRGWLHRWQNIIPAYIDWETRRQAHWSVAATETPAEKPRGEIKLFGIIDRLDRQDDDYAVIDYKTGSIRSNRDINNGEAVQLPFYALVSNANVNHVAYLKLDDKGAKPAGTLEGDTLQQLVAAQAERLDTVFGALAAGASLPAWGDENACKHCDMNGLCRRDAWQVEEEA